MGGDDRSPRDGGGAGTRGRGRVLREAPPSLVWLLGWLPDGIDRCLAHLVEPHLALVHARALRIEGRGDTRGGEGLTHVELHDGPSHQRVFACMSYITHLHNRHAFMQWDGIISQRGRLLTGGCDVRVRAMPMAGPGGRGSGRRNM